jgi:hypothetical protein
MITLPVVNGIVQGVVPANAVRQIMSATQCVIYQHGDVIPLIPGPTPQEIADAEAVAAKLRTDAVAASQYTKLRNLTALSPAEVQTWVANNVNTIADVKDAITTLAVAISVLGRPLAGGAVPRSGPPELAAKSSPPPTMWQKTVSATKSMFTPKGKK